MKAYIILYCSSISLHPDCKKELPRLKVLRNKFGSIRAARILAAFYENEESIRVVLSKVTYDISDKFIPNYLGSEDPIITVTEPSESQPPSNQQRSNQDRNITAQDTKPTDNRSPHALRQTPLEYNLLLFVVIG